MHICNCVSQFEISWFHRRKIVMHHWKNLNVNVVNWHRGKLKIFGLQSNQLPQNNTLHYQELVNNTALSESPHQQPSIDLRYIEIGDGLPGEENQLNGLGTLGGLGLNLPVNFQECEVENNELDQYLPSQTAQIHQYPPMQVTTTSQWLLNRYSHS